MAKKKKLEKIDGEINGNEIERIRTAIRRVWGWTSLARKLCIKRATDKMGFGICEFCGEKVPKVYADHIKVMGDVLAPDYIKRMWCHSSELQALCKSCHSKKTRLERKAKRKLFTDIY